MRAIPALSLILFLLVALPAKAAPVLPTEADCFHALNEYHGACGHPLGEDRLSGLLLQLAPQTEFEFTAALVECFAAAPLPPFTEAEELFMWLATFEDDPDYAYDSLVARLAGNGTAPTMMKIASMRLVDMQSAETRDELLALLTDDDDPKVRTSAIALRNTRASQDPYALGAATDYDFTGATYQLLFAEVGLRPLCTCPAEKRGTPAELEWCELFLALHPEGFADQPMAAAHGWLTRWIAQFTEAKTPRQRGMAAVVIWRLGYPQAASEAASDATGA